MSESNCNHLDASSIGDVFGESVISVEIVRSFELGNSHFHVGILASEALALQSEECDVIWRPPGLQISVLRSRKRMMGMPMGMTMMVMMVMMGMGMTIGTRWDKS